MATDTGSLPVWPSPGFAGDALKHRGGRHADFLQTVSHRSYIEVAGKAGTVKNVSLFTTELCTPDNVQIILPNSQAWSGSMVNSSHHETRRVDFLLGISYSDNIDKAFSVINSVIGDDKRIHSDPAPQVVVSELADSSVNITVRVWVESGDYRGVKFDLTKQFREAMDANSLSIPFPQQDVHLIQSA